MTIINYLINKLAKLLFIKNQIYFRILEVKIGKNLMAIAPYRFSKPEKMVIGNNVYIGRFVTLGSDNGLIIDDDVIISDFVSFYSADHSFDRIDKPIRLQGMKDEKKPIVIEQDVWIGEKSTILKQVRVGRGAVIGAHSVITKDIPPFAVVAGNPAKIIRYRKNSLKK